MDLKQLNYIVAISENGSISKAARKLYISQPALSLYLSRLEESLGITLFERQKTALVPTQAGILYIKAAKEILEIKKKLYIQLDELSFKNSELLDIGIIPLTCSSMISAVYSQYKSLYPQNHLQITESSSHVLEQMLLDKKLKIAILVYRQPLHSEICYAPIRREPFYLAISAQHPLTDKLRLTSETVVSLRDLSNESFILAPQGTVRREIEDHAFSVSRITPRVLCEINNVLTAERMVRNNEGIAFFAQGYIKKQKDILYLPIDIEPHWFIGSAHLKKAVLHKHEKQLLQLAEEYYQTHLYYS